MRKNKIAIISALLLYIHGLIEITAPILLVVFNADIRISDIGNGISSIKGIAICIIGASWGITRMVAGWGILKMRKWAITLGILLSTITMATSINLIPAGIADTVLSAPVLVLLLYLWFNQEKV